MTGRRVALLVANDRYEQVTLPRLAAPAAEAAQLAEVLGDDTLGGFEVELLCNATSQTVYERLDQLFADGTADDLVLVHFAGHGLRSDDGELYLATSNTRPALLASTAVDAGRVSRLMRRSRAGSIVLFLDCCYGGAFAKGLIPRSDQMVDVRSSFAAPDLSGGRGHVVVTAASAIQFAYERGGADPDGDPVASLFTRALIDGIRTGDADRDEDGRIDLDELYEFVEQQVLVAHPDQHPNRWHFGTRGKIYVAQSARRRIRPTALPQSVRDLLDHGVANVRFAAAHELRDLVEGPDLPLAAAARAALTALQDDDSRKVSAAAQEILAVTAVQLSQSAADLGVVTGGDPAEVLQVQLKGGPLAYASAVVAPPAVKARIVGDTLHLRLTGDQPGPVDATVTVTGPAGDAAVRVTGWVALDPRLPAAAAAALAESLDGDPADVACALAAASWAAHVTGDAARALTLLDRADALARDIAEPAAHALVTALVDWVGARSGDTRRAARVPSDLAAAARVVFKEPERSAVAQAGLAWLGRVSRAEWPGGGPVWWTAALDAVRWAIRDLGSAERSTVLIMEANSTVDAVHDRVARSVARLAVDLAWGHMGAEYRARALIGNLTSMAVAAKSDPKVTVPLLLGAAWLAAVAGRKPSALPHPLDLPPAAAGLLTRVTGLDRVDPSYLRASARLALATTTRTIATLDPQWRPFAHVAVAWIALLVGDGKQADAAIEAAKAAADDEYDPDLRPLAWAAIGWMFAHNGQAATGSQFLTRAEQAAIGDDDILEKVAALAVTAAATPDDDPDTRRRRLAAAVVAAETLTDPAWRSAARIAIAWLLVRSGDTTQGLDLLAATEPIIDTVDDDDQALLRAAVSWVGTQAGDSRWTGRLFTDLFAFAETGNGDWFQALVTGLIALLEGVSAQTEPGVVPEAVLRIVHRFLGRFGDEEQATSAITEALSEIDEDFEDVAVVFAVLLAAAVVVRADERVLDDLLDVACERIDRVEVRRLLVIGKGLLATLIGDEDRTLPALEQVELEAAADDDPALRAATLTVTAWIRSGYGDAPARRALTDAYDAVQRLGDAPERVVLLAAVAWIAASA